MWPWVDSDTGLWIVTVFRNGKPIWTCKRDYPCHASYSKPGAVGAGDIFSFEGLHKGWLSQRIYSVYGICRVPTWQ